jgi:hypothetical protein
VRTGNCHDFTPPWEEMGSQTPGRPLAFCPICSPTGLGSSGWAISFSHLIIHTAHTCDLGPARNANLRCDPVNLLHVWRWAEDWLGGGKISAQLFSFQPGQLLHVTSSYCIVASGCRLQSVAAVATTTQLITATVVLTSRPTEHTSVSSAGEKVVVVWWFAPAYPNKRTVQYFMYDYCTVPVVVDLTLPVRVPCTTRRLLAGTWHAGCGCPACHRARSAARRFLKSLLVRYYRQSLPPSLLLFAHLHHRRSPSPFPLHDLHSPFSSTRQHPFCSTCDLLHRSVKRCILEFASHLLSEDYR